MQSQENCVPSIECSIKKNYCDTSRMKAISFKKFKDLSNGIAFPNNVSCLIPSAVISNKYILGEQIEAGSLHRCVSLETGEEYLCKILKKDKCGQEFLQAHHALKDSPLINPIHEILVGSTCTYVIFLRGFGDLHSYVRSKRRLKEAEVRKLFSQIAEAVRCCHDNGIVLRDLKLRKFVFADISRTKLKLESLEGSVVLSDPSDDRVRRQTACPAYLSPEIILLANAHVSGRAADIWSLGVMLYTMLVGRYPFFDPDAGSLFAKIKQGVYVLPDFLSSISKCLIRALLWKEPCERLEINDVLRHPWLASEYCFDDVRFSVKSESSDQIVPCCEDSIVPGSEPKRQRIK